MSGSNSKKKRSGPPQTPTSILQPNVIHSLLDSYDFLASNEYSEKTIGLQSFLLRKGVGDINFSEIIDDSDKRNRQGQTTSCVAILEDKRASLPDIDASVEKCMMLTRLICYIQENQSLFTALLSDVRIEMQYNMTDTQSDQTNLNFAKRINDFNTRRLAQEKRRLFFFNHKEVGEPANLVSLQNRTTEQLNYLLTRKSNSKSTQLLTQEFETILKTSFLIGAQPHSGVNPITIYERRRPGEYTAKISVTVISLLHDFMEQHPGLIELVDIEPSLQPASIHYKLAEPQTISWKPCQIQTELSGRSRTFLCAELSSITVEQSSKTDTRVRFAQLLHSLKFAIKIHFHSAEFKIPIIQLALDSLQFGIGAHNNQIPQLLTRVLLDDIRHFAQDQQFDVKVIHEYVVRYFIHRTGVHPNEWVKHYLEQELNKAKTIRKSFHTLEDIYLDFLVNFVYQVEFMAKHPILSMFHDDGLFLGICSSERATEAMIQSVAPGYPVIELRFNSIRIDYNAISTLYGANRTVKLQPCAIRVDIYNNRVRNIQNRTFDSTVLTSDISKFVSSADSENASRIRVLSQFDDQDNGKNFVSFKNFRKYYHPDLQKICKCDDKYKPVTDLVENATDGNFEEEFFESLNLTSNNIITPSPYTTDSLPPISSPGLFDFEQNTDSNNTYDYMNVGYENSNGNYSSPTSNIFSPPPPPQQQQPSVPVQLNQEAVLRQIMQNNPNLVQQLLHQYQPINVNNATPIETQTQYQISPSPYPTQMQMINPQQRPQIQIIQQPIYQQPHMYPQTQVQFIPPQQQQQQSQRPMQTFIPQQIIYQQRPPQALQPQSVIHYTPTSTFQTFPQQTHQMPVYQPQPQENQFTNENTNISQQQQQIISFEQTTMNNIDIDQLFNNSESTTTTTT